MTLCVCVWAHINDSISLDVVHVWVHDAQLLAVSLGGADDAGGDSVLQSKGAANRHHKLPWPQISWAAQRQHRKVLLLPYRHTYIQSELSTTQQHEVTWTCREKKYKWWMRKGLLKRGRRREKKEEFKAYKTVQVFEIWVREYTHQRCVCESQSWCLWNYSC